jgi:hypothetical protein
MRPAPKRPIFVIIYSFKSWAGIDLQEIPRIDTRLWRSFKASLSHYEQSCILSADALL